MTNPRRSAEAAPAPLDGLAPEFSQAGAQQWLADTRAAMDAWNDHVEQHGLPLAEFRSF